MLRIHCLQLWFDLSDPAVEEALYDSRAMRAFVGIDLGQEPVQTTVMRFRHLLEHNKLGEKIFEEVGRVLLSRGLKVSKGTIVDATIIAAPSSTKNAEGSRDPQMHQTKKGRQWYFGMKVHVGVDAQSKVIHSVLTTPANTADCKVLGDLLHGHEGRVYGDQAYKGQCQIIRAKAPQARDFTNRQCKWKHYVDQTIRAKNRTKSRIRSRVEHSIGVIKRVFGFTKVRYRALAKNANRVFVTAALANIFMLRYRLMGTLRPQ
jgi:transposase, IS5 family